MNEEHIRVDFSTKFNKQLKKVPLAIKKAFSVRLGLFKQDRFHPQLRNHALSGKFKYLRSINVTGDWRAIYAEKQSLEGKTIVFELVATHSQLYR